MCSYNSSASLIVSFYVFLSFIVSSFHCFFVLVVRILVTKSGNLQIRYTIDLVRQLELTHHLPHAVHQMDVINSSNAAPAATRPATKGRRAWEQCHRYDSKAHLKVHTPAAAVTTRKSTPKYTNTHTHSAAKTTTTRATLTATLTHPHIYTHTHIHSRSYRERR